jgi:hypothetical protein
VLEKQLNATYVDLAITAETKKKPKYTVDRKYFDV